MATPSQSQRVVESVLKESALREKQLKTIQVVKSIDVDIDPGNLLAVDPNPIHLTDFRKNQQSFLKDLARDNIQLLFNNIWQLPAQRVDEVIVVKVPDPTTALPREKHIPKANPLTKWQQYTQAKGIHKRKKSRTLWDGEEQKWVPRWGYGSKNDLRRDWLLEVPDNADPYKDMFADKKKDKKERVAKNEFQRLRNIQRAQKLKIPGQGLKPKAISSKPHVSMAIQAAKQSTASIGKFERKLPKEKPTKRMGKKRQFNSVTGDMKQERSREMTILDNLHRKKPQMDVNKAVNKEIQAEEQEAASGFRKRKIRSVTKSSKALPKATKRRNKIGSKKKKGNKR